MRQVDHRIKRRRDERIRSLQQHRSPWPTVPRDFPGGAAARGALGMEYRARPLSSRERAQKGRSRLVVQTVIALLLFGFTYVVFQADTSLARQAQAFITDVMERDFNFQGVADWYEANLGGMPAIIPAFSKNNNTADKSSLRPANWTLPVQGQVVQRYSEDHPYVTLNGSGERQVTASAEGLVSFVGEKEGWGQCVILQHAGDMETWYGSLSDVQVELSDWVQPEELLGQLSDAEGTVQFGVKQGGQFVDPFDVIKVE